MDRYDVVVSTLDAGADRAHAAAVIGSTLGPAAADAAGGLDALPATIAEDVDEATAMSAVSALRAAGVRVRLTQRAPRARSSSSATVAAQPRALPSTAPRAHGELDAEVHADLPLPDLDLAPVAEPVRRPPAPVPVVTAPAPRPVASVAVDEAPPIFFSLLPGALAMPFGASGIAWFMRFLGVVVAAALFSAALQVIAAFVPAGALLALGGAITAGGWTFGMVIRWFGANFAAARAGDASPDPPGQSDGGAFWTAVMLYVISIGANGAVIYAWVVGHQAAAGEGSLDLGSPSAVSSLLWMLLALNLAIATYQPLGLSLVSMRGSPLAFFDLLSALRIATGAPLQLACTYAILLGATGILFAGAFLGTVAVAMLSRWLVLLAVLLAAMLFFMVWGAGGAMMGALLRAHPID